MSRRADYGSGSFARPAEKMGRGRSGPCFGETLKDYTGQRYRLTSPVKRTLKRGMAKKRRQWDREAVSE